MYTKIQVAFDAADPPKLAAFWALALGCIPEPPPEGFVSWEDFGRSIGMPEERFGDQAAVIDPEGAGPRVYFQRVSEGKTAKNRVHLDVRVAGLEVRGEERAADRGTGRPADRGGCLDRLAGERHTRQQRGRARSGGKRILRRMTTVTGARAEHG